MAITRSIRIEWPDGSVTRSPLPRAAKVRAGGLSNILLVWQGRLIVLWLKRVKGGWEPMTRSDAQRRGIAARRNERKGQA
jgi:hypothetical protein